MASDFETDTGETGTFCIPCPTLLSHCKPGKISAVVWTRVGDLTGNH